MAINIQLRRDTAANWTAANPLLLDGEFGIESDSKKFKLGDGVTHWNALPYGGPQGVTPPELITELAWDDSFPSNYSELTYDGTTGLITELDIWDTSAKAIHLFSKVYAYASGVLSSVTITRVQTGSKIVKSINYSGGKPFSVTRVYTP
jgi:hypothetical protein